MQILIPETDKPLHFLHNWEDVGHHKSCYARYVIIIIIITI